MSSGPKCKALHGAYNVLVVRKTVVLLFYSQPQAPGNLEFSFFVTFYAILGLSRHLPVVTNGGNQSTR